MRLFFLFLVLIHPSEGAWAKEFRAKVIAVIDGDTVMVVRPSDRPIKVRLVGIDAPEMAQEYGPESKASLLEMVLHKQVLVSSKMVDDYGRLLAEITVGGLNVNHEQVRRGMAWDYSRINNRELAALQREAQQARRGLWTAASAIEPSKWRKQHPSEWSAPAAAASASPTVVADPCSKKRCAEMTSCEEAKYYLAHCHIKTIDGDGDGIPCERLCAEEKGNTH